MRLEIVVDVSVVDDPSDVVSTLSEFFSIFTIVDSQRSPYSRHVRDSKTGEISEKLFCIVQLFSEPWKKKRF